MNKIEKTLVEYKNLTFGNNREVMVLNDINFSILQNVYICIIGHNGSGKSTISKVLTGLLKPMSGELYIKDNLIDHTNINFIRSLE